MTVAYDKYYRTKNLFGKPYPELIDFFVKCPSKGRVLDLGCGQGRNAIPLARLGFSVTGIDTSTVGIQQMNRIAKIKNLSLDGKIADIFEINNFAEYDYILFDSMFHFAKNDGKKETEFIKRIVSKIKKRCVLVFCIQDTRRKTEILNETIDFAKQLDRLADKKFEYIFEDSDSGHKSRINYQMVVVKK